MQYKLTIPGRLPGLNELIEAERANRYKGAQLKIGRASCREECRSRWSPYH